MSNCNCSSNQGIYSSNAWYGTPTSSNFCGHQQACNGCIDIVKDICIRYTKPNLTNTGINQNDTLDVILQKLDALKALQDTTNANILIALNDLNDRVNALETDASIPGGGSHADYVI